MCLSIDADSAKGKGNVRRPSQCSFKDPSVSCSGIPLSLSLAFSVVASLLPLLLRNYPTLSACSWLLFIKRRCSYCLVQWYKLKIPILFGIRMRVWVPGSLSPSVHALLVFVLIFFIAFSLFPLRVCVCSCVLCVVCGTRLSTLS